MESKILLETGTNELEVLEFTIAGNSYGINVAKIREIINYQPVTPIPNAHPSIEGIFMPRDTMITAVSLSNCLQLGDSQPGGLFIITNFNKLDCAFHVENVVGIHRVSWTQIMKPESTLSSTNDGISTGIVNINGKLIVIRLKGDGYTKSSWLSNTDWLKRDFYNGRTFFKHLSICLSSSCLSK